LNKIFKNLSIYLLIILIAVFIMKYLSPETQTIKELKYNQFVQQLEQGNIKSVVMQSDKLTNIITGTLNNGTKFSSRGPVQDERVIPLMLEQKVDWDQQLPPEPAWWMALATSFLPILLLIAVFFFMMQQSQGGGNKVMSFGKSRAKLHTDEKEKVTFNDVAGADEVKEELEEIVEFLKSPKKFNDLGAKIPKGVLLSGAPGTGKTLLARAVAGEAGVPFFSISGSDFVEMFVGVGASRVRDLFGEAKKNSPCIIFIDEIDAVGRQRGAGLGGGHDEREQTLNQLLVEMDGFNANAGIIIIAATNRPDILDPALLRPGRFDRQVTVDRPDVVGRREILKVHIKGKPLEESVDLDVLARRTPGFTGADLANLVNEAALLSGRIGKKTIGMAELESSIERVIAGPEKKSRVISDKEKKLVSYHEAGHAVVGFLLPNTDPVHKVSIIPRGRAGGYTLVLPKEDRSYITKSQLLDQVTMFLGGRVAEAIILNEISTGASSDLERATGIVRKMITEWGMSEELGPLALSHSQEQVFLGRDIGSKRDYSEEVAYQIDKEVKSWMEKAYKDAEKLLLDNIDKLHLIAQALMDREVIEATEFANLMEGKAGNVNSPVKEGVVEIAKENDAVDVVKTNEETVVKTEEEGENN